MKRAGFLILIAVVISIGVTVVPLVLDADDLFDVVALPGILFERVLNSPPRGTIKKDADMRLVVLGNVLVWSLCLFAALSLGTRNRTLAGTSAS